jgi:hypothetical protein
MLWMALALPASAHAAAPAAPATSAFGDSLDPRAQLAAADIRSEEAAALFRDDVCGHREDDHPLPRVAEKPDHIFVSIASYRDERCKITLADLFAKAAQPERITVAVVQQNDADVAAEDCIVGCPACREQLQRGRVLLRDYDHTQARGPAFARWAASRLWDGSEFFLQIDAHSEFQPGWDQSLIEQYRAVGDPDAILTHHPPPANRIESMLARKRTVLNCRAEFDDAGIFVQRAQVVEGGPGALPSPFAAGGFLFMPGRVLQTVPYDPYLVFVFHPEEALSSARLWTAGHNLYAPAVPVLTHEYDEGEQPLRHYERAPELRGCLDRAITRAQFLLGILPLEAVDPSFRAGLDRYGIGGVRPLADFYRQAGLDVSARTATSLCPAAKRKSAAQ